jgi:head-tail adaptor
MPYDLSADLASARTEANEFLFDTGAVYRPTRTRDAAGGVVEAYDPVPGMDSVPVNVKLGKTLTAVLAAVVADRESVQEQATLEAPFGTDIRAADRIDVSGKVWQVTGETTDALGAYSTWDIERVE